MKVQQFVLNMSHSALADQKYLQFDFLLIATSQHQDQDRKMRIVGPITRDDHLNKAMTVDSMRLVRVCRRRYKASDGHTLLMRCDGASIKGTTPPHSTQEVHSRRHWVAIGQVTWGLVVVGKCEDNGLSLRTQETHR